MVNSVKGLCSELTWIRQLGAGERPGGDDVAGGLTAMDL